MKYLAVIAVWITCVVMVFVFGKSFPDLKGDSVELTIFLILLAAVGTTYFLVRQQSSCENCCDREEDPKETDEQSCCGRK